jgi:hypothetical protein
VGSEFTTVSTERGDGIPDLIAATLRRLLPDAPPPAAAVPFRAQQRDQLLHTRDRLLAGDHGAARRALENLLEPHTPR